MTLAEFFEFVVEDTKKLDIELRAYQVVFDSIKKTVSRYPQHSDLLKTLCLDATGLDDLLVGAKSAPHLQGTRLSKYDSILEMLHPRDVPAPTLTEVEKWLQGINKLDWN
jgi:hypothetical protein